LYKILINFRGDNVSQLHTGHRRKNGIRNNYVINIET